MSWPVPEMLGEKTNVMLFFIRGNRDPETTSWMSPAHITTPTAIITFETPDILSGLERMNFYGVLIKPMRLFGVFAAQVAAVGFARHKTSLRRQIRSLDEPLKSRRKVEKAVPILSMIRNISEQDAYKRLREKPQYS